MGWGWGGSHPVPHWDCLTRGRSSRDDLLWGRQAWPPGPVCGITLKSLRGSDEASVAATAGPASPPPSPLFSSSYRMSPHRSLADGWMQTSKRAATTVVAGATNGGSAGAVGVPDGHLIQSWGVQEASQKGSSEMTSTRDMAGAGRMIFNLQVVLNGRGKTRVFIKVRQMAAGVGGSGQRAGGRGRPFAASAPPGLSDLRPEPT